VLKQKVDVFPAFLANGVSQRIVFLVLCFVTCEKFGKAVKAHINRNAQRCITRTWRHDEGSTGVNPLLDLVETASTTKSDQFFRFQNVQHVHGN
jgi:hypothetical protein